MAQNAPNEQVSCESEGANSTTEGNNEISSNSDSGNHSASLECSDSKLVFLEGSSSQSGWSIEEEEKYAREGMITFLSDPTVAMEHFKAGMARGQSPVIHYGYAFVFFIRSMVTYTQVQQEEAQKVLETASAHCHKSRKSQPKGSSRRLYYATLEHDCELFQAFLYFLRESVPGYIKGGLGIRKVWKAYAKTFKKAEKLFSSRTPIRPPFSDPGEAGELDSELMQQLQSLEAKYPSAAPPEGDKGLVEVGLGGMDPAEEDRVRRAVYMGYGTFHLMLSLIPKKFLGLANMLGFQGDRRFGLECLQFGLTGKDMRQPIAAINLLGFHTLIVPFTSLSNTADPIGHMEKIRSILSHLTAVSPNSSLVQYFSARIALLNRDTDLAMIEFKLAGQGSFFPKDLLLLTSWDRCNLAMLKGNFQLAHELAQDIITWATKLVGIYQHIFGLLTGYQSDAREALKIFENWSKQKPGASHPMEKFAARRCAYYCKHGVTYVGMHVALLEHLYIMNGFLFCPPAELAMNLESVQGSVASATDPLTRCLGLLAQGSILKYLGCPNEAEESFGAILACDAKQLKNDKHILVYANIEMSIIARQHRKDAARSISFLHTARDKFSDYDLDSRTQMIIDSELSLSKAFRKQEK